MFGNPEIRYAIGTFTAALEPQIRSKLALFPDSLLSVAKDVE